MKNAAPFLEIPSRWPKQINLNSFLIFRAGFLRWQVSGESQPSRASGVHPQSPWKSRDSIPPRLHGLTDQCGRQAAACHPGSSARQIRSGRLHACFHTASATASRSSVPSGKAVQKYAILENRKARGQGRIRPTLPLRMPVRAVQTSAVPGFVPALDTCRLRKSVKEGGPKASFPKEHPSLKCVPSRILCRKTIFQATLGLAGSRAEPEFLDRLPILRHRTDYLRVRLVYHRRIEQSQVNPCRGFRIMPHRLADDRKRDLLAHGNAGPAVPGAMESERQRAACHLPHILQPKSVIRLWVDCPLMSCSMLLA